MSRLRHHSTSVKSSSSLKPLSATVLILTRRPGLLRGVDPADHLRQAAPAGDVGEFRLVERVERDVHAPHACRKEVAREAFELRAVRGQRQFLERAALEVPRHGMKEGHDPLAHQRLAAGDPQLLHAHRDEGRAHAVELLQRQQLLLGQEGHVFGHAVDAAEIAAVGDGDAQIGDRALERIDEGLCHAINVSPGDGRGKPDPASCRGGEGRIPLGR